MAKILSRVDLMVVLQERDVSGSACAGDLAVSASFIDDPKNYNRVWDLQSKKWWPLEGGNRVNSIEFSREENEFSQQLK